MSVTDTWAEWKTDDTNKPSGLDSPEIDDELRNIKKQVKLNCAAYTNVLAAEGIREYATLPAAITAIGTSSTILLVDTAVAVSTDATMPSTLAVSVTKPGMFNISSGVTLTINGPIDAGPYQIFSCTGTGKVVFGKGSVTEIYPEWWQTNTTPGTTNMQVGIQSALTACVNSGFMIKVKLLSSQYKLDTGLSLDAGFASLDGNGAYTNAGDMASGTALAVTATAGTGLNNQCVIENFFLQGPVGSAPKGITFVGTSASYAVAGISVRNVWVERFSAGHEHGSQSYLMNFFNCIMRNCDIGVSSLAGTNCGEMNAYFGGQIAGCDIGVKQENYNGDISFHGVGIDYNDVQVDCSRGRASFFDCHFEGNITGTPYTSTPFTIGNFQDSVLVIIGGTVNCMETLAAQSVDYLIDVGAAGTCFLKGVTLINTLTATNTMVTGTGRIVVDDVMGYYGGGNHLDNDMLSVQANKFFDGGFEQATVLEAAITKDSAAITDRVTGTNLALTTSATEAHAGTKSLKVAKSGGNPSNCGVTIYVPITPGKHVGVSFWYRKPGTETGTMYAYGYYAQLQYHNGYGTPIFSQLTQDTGVASTITFTSAAVAWTEVQKTMGIWDITPNWATHYAIILNMDGLDAGSYYFDDVLVTEY